MIPVRMSDQKVYVIEKREIHVVKPCESVHRTIDQDQLIVCHEIRTVMLIGKSGTSSKKLQHLFFLRSDKT